MVFTRIQPAKIRKKWQEFKEAFIQGIEYGKSTHKSLLTVYESFYVNI